MGDTDKDWEQWAQIDPYFAVLAQDQFHGGNNREEFFSLGERDVERFLGDLEAQFGPVPRRKALDFGCGVGRLTKPLADQFGHVDGLDISPSMLREAEKNSTASFALADDGLSNASGPYDFVLSRIVMQHIPTERGYRIFKNLLSVVGDEGGFAIHFCIRKLMPKPTPGFVLGLLKWPLDRLRGAAGPVMQMNPYSMSALVSIAADAGFTRIYSVYEDHYGSESVMLIGKRMPDQ